MRGANFSQSMGVSSPAPLTITQCVNSFLSCVVSWGEDDCIEPGYFSVFIKLLGSGGGIGSGLRDRSTDLANLSSLNIFNKSMAGQSSSSLLSF